MIYLDHAATSWPKPPEVTQAMADFLARAGGNPGRSGHRLSIEAGRIVYDAREAMAELFGVADPLRVIFTLNATHALNIALAGLLRPGDRVVTSGMEHNAVMRPLRGLEGRATVIAATPARSACADRNQPTQVGFATVAAVSNRPVALTILPCRRDGTLDLAEAARLITPGTRLVVLNHASNVCGTIQPVAEIAAMAHRAGALLLVDAAQTAGVLPIDVGTMGIDLLAFTGHKGLQGPPGTGGLILGARVDAGRIEPFMRGGTGSRSESEEQPEDLPDKFEAGTPNGVGIAGLGAGVRWVLSRGVEAIRAHEVALARALIAGLAAIPGVTVHGPRDAELCTATISFTAAGRRVSEIGWRLDEEHGVLSRVGLHCAPAAHRTLGTFPEGTVRLAPGVFTTLDDVQTAVRAVAQVAAS
jgi:selenocysteine lyase/cysteine desulfurase